MERKTLARVVAVGLAVAGVGGLVTQWRRKGSSPGGDERTAAAREPWTCECGQAYVVSGEGRHRVYWVEGADDGDPVLGTECVNCERPLPAGATRA